MRDFRIVHAKIVLKVFSASPLRGFLPPAIAVIGDKLNLAEEVFYNGVEAKEFFIQSPNKMLIRIPQSQIGKNLNEIKILSSVQLARQDALVSFEVSKNPKTVAGIDRLVQSWILLFLSTPGSDIFNLHSGGGARSLIGVIDGKKDVSADLALAVDRTKIELIRLQSNNPRIPADERLLSASLLSVQYDEQTTTLSAVVDIKNSIGDQAEVSIG